MTSVGETLRRERLSRNLELDQISQELKISVRFLEAIEEERFEQLPGAVFAKSFVRQYARMLGLDEEELAGEVRRVLDPPPSFTAEPAEEMPHPVAEIHVPRVDDWAGAHEKRRSGSLAALALVVLVMLVCSVVYSWWQRERRQVSAHEENAARPVAQATQPAQSAQGPPAQPQTAGGQTAAPQTGAPQTGAPETGALPVAQHNSADRPGPEGAPGGTSPSSTTPSNVTAAAKPPISTAGGAAQAVPGAAPANPGAPRKSPAADDDATVNPRPAQASNPGGETGSTPATVRLELTADEPVWVLARADGKYLFSGTVEPNQTRTIEGNGTIVVRLGNAGGVSITLNGKSIGPIGPRGQVRTVQFTSGGFQIVAAPKPSLPDPLL